MICPAEASDTLSVVKRLQSELSNFIEPDFGLLDQLLSLEVLTRRQYDDVHGEKRATYRRSEALLDLLTTQDQCDKFLKALKKTGQQHVVNYITQRGGQKLYHVIKFQTAIHAGLSLYVCYSLSDFITVVASSLFHLTLNKFHLVCLQLDIK